MCMSLFLLLSPDDLAKVFGLQKSMYDSGASPQVSFSELIFAMCCA